MQIRRLGTLALVTSTCGVQAFVLPPAGPAAQVTRAISSSVSLRSGLNDHIIDAMSALPFHVFNGLADDAVEAVAAADAVKDDGGVFGALTHLVENSIIGLHTALNGIGIESSYGISIILFTLFVKGITFPLTYKQLSSTTKMQVLQPKVKEIQKKYANNPEAANQAIAELYKEEEINPLSGCLPTFAQIPIFISLYRALLNLAKEDKLSEPFLWLPSLEGPTFGADPADSMNWIKVWTDGQPSLGWHDTLCYLTIPVILVISQSISQQLMQPPKKPGQEADTSQAILKFLPLMIGYFSLNVPSGLGVYWIVNNFISTAASVFIRNQLAPATPDQTTSNTSNSFSATSAEIRDVEYRSIGDNDDDNMNSDMSESEDEPKGFGAGSAGEVEGEIIPANDSIKKLAKSAGGKKKKGRKNR